MNSAVAAVTEGPSVHKKVKGSSLMTTVLPFRDDVEDVDAGMVKVCQQDVTGISRWLKRVLVAHRRHRSPVLLGHFVLFSLQCFR